VLALGGPGGDIILSGPGLLGFSPVLLFVLGVAPPGWVLLRRRAGS
jgi:hypothetical protein